MKKSSSNSKDRLATRSANVAKRPSLAVLSKHALSELPEFNDSQWTPWPEWSEADINAEKWNVKVVFEDIDTCLSYMPKSLRGQVESLKRPIEFLTNDMTPAIITNDPDSSWCFQKPISSSTTASPVSTSAYSSIPVTPNAPRTASYSQYTLNKDITSLNTSLQPSSSSSSLSSSNPPTLYTPVVTTAPMHPTMNSNTSLSGTIGSLSATLPMNSNSVIPSTNLDPTLPLDQNLNIPTSPSTPINNPTSPSTPTSPSLHTYAMFPSLKPNLHILHSDIVRDLLTKWWFLITHFKEGATESTLDHWRPWDLIYPKSKDGLPMYNTSGKYAVKLFFGGAWRKIIIDDKVPMDNENRVLFISTPNPNELWPWLLTKALFKVMCLSSDERENFSELGDFQVFHTLLGCAIESWNFSKLPHPSTPFQRLKVCLDSISPRTSAGKTKPLSPPSVMVIGTIDPTVPSEQGADPWPSYIRILSMHPEFIKCLVFHLNLNAWVETGASEKDIASKLDGVQVLWFPSSFKKWESFMCMGSGQHDRYENLSKAIPILYNPHSDRAIDVYVSFLCHARWTPKKHRCPSLTVEPYFWDRCPGTCDHHMGRIATNAIQSTWLHLDPLKAIRFYIDTPGNFAIQWGCLKDEFALEEELKYIQDKSGVHVQEFEETAPSLPSGVWNVLFKYTFNLKQPTLLGFHLLLPESMTEATHLRFINNDQPTTTWFSGAHFLSPEWHTPNTLGYVLMAESKLPNARNPSKWKLRVFSKPSLVPSDMGWKPWVQEYEDQYIPNKANLLFRNVVRLVNHQDCHVSMHLTLAMPSIFFIFQILENETVCYQARSKEALTMPNFVFRKSEDVPAGQDKKSTTSTSHSSRRYIVQVFIEPSDQFQVTNLPESSPLRPRASLKPTNSNPSISKRKSISPNGAHQSHAHTEWRWNLKVTCSDSQGLLISKDTEKEDRHQRIKETWEQKQQGRSAKAKEIRDNFIKGPAPPTPPVVYGPKSLKPIDPWLVSYPLTWPIEKKRAEDTHKSILEALESHGTELRVFKELDFQLRQLHRQHTLKDIEDQIVKIATLMAKEQEAALEASAAAAAAAAQAVAVQDESKEKKKKR